MAQFIEHEKGVVKARRFTIEDAALLRKLDVDVRFAYGFQAR